MTTSLLILDSRVAATFPSDALPKGMRLVVLDTVTDGLAQLGAAVAGMRDVGAIHIVSHGASGALLLGSGELTTASLLAGTLAEALAPDADVLLYGCDVGEGEAGAAFVATLARLTGADVAASADATGPVSGLGTGSWSV